MNKDNKHGFTLLELSIVLVIIALIVGSIVFGSSMIRNSKLQSIVAESARYTQAITAFRDKYYSLPGDFKTATSIWGTASGGCPTGANGSATATCNGDGNGRIVNFDAAPNTYTYANSYTEQFRAWQHLSNAKLIEGNFTGTTTSGTYQYTIGTNIPASRLDGAGWRVLNVTTYDISSALVTTLSYSAGDIEPNVILWFGGSYFENSPRMSGVISPQEAFQIDSKTDDGKPFTGRWIAQSSSGMANSCDDGASGYSSTNDSRTACSLVFKTGL